MKYLIALLLIATPSFASTIETSYSYSSDPYQSNSHAMTPVGSDIKTTPYSVPEDTTHTLVSPARVHPTDLPKEVEAPKLQAQIAQLNAKMDAVHAALLTAEAKTVKGTMEVE